MCTNISILSKEGDLFWGRTMDFRFNPFTVGSQVSIVPRDFHIKGMGAEWVSKYRFMGANMGGSYFFFDGMNEKGLVGDVQYLYECTRSTQEDLDARGLKPLYGPEVVTFVLSNFANVDEVAEGMKHYGLVKEDKQVGVINGIQIPEEAPLHYTFSDPSGKTIVLEPTDNGAFRIFENTMGVMTNSPTYDWHMTNLRNYINLSGVNKPGLELAKETKVAPLGNGSGLLGLPGDYTSPSRFIRAAYLSHYIDPFTSAQGINTLYKLFQTVMIPKGIEKLSADSEASDFTGYWSGYDVANKTLYIQPEDSITMTVLTLNGEEKDTIETFEVEHDMLVNKVN